MEDVKPRYTPGVVKEEDIVRMPDHNGEIQELTEVEGLVIPVALLTKGHIPDMRDNIQKIRAMHCRDDDIFLCAYSRSGTHWVWEITNMLTTGKLEYLNKPKETAMLEFNYPEEFDGFPSPRVLNTHFPIRLLPTDVKDKKLKILFVQRNPKDVMVSSYHFLKKSKVIPFKGDFKDFFTFFATIGVFLNWFDYTLESEKVILDKELDIHVIYYEELKKDPTNVIKGISEFLGTDRDDEYIQKVADMCHFKGMKKADEGKDIERFKFEADMMTGHYRKGEVGDWKNYLTVKQNEQFDEIFSDRMKNSTFKFQFTPNL